ncbi:hypothetical protein F5Y15DRAFT_31892 [Xylariaceae sp. FL0016]|nr:hypothetical protein F5Y15DRAFT_31892 [Xylariaceae sp. FL0016]
MFFNVVMIIHEIRDLDDAASVLRSIDQSPLSLDQMIANVFQRVLDRYNHGAALLLDAIKLVALAERPLSLTELVCFIKPHDGQLPISLEAKIMGPLASILTLNAPTSTKFKEKLVLERDRTMPDLKVDDRIASSSDSESDDEATSSDLKDLTPASVSFHWTTWRRYNVTYVHFRHTSIKDFLLRGAENFQSISRLSDPSSHWFVAQLGLKSMIHGVFDQGQAASPDHCTVKLIPSHLARIKLCDVPTDVIQMFFQDLKKLVEDPNTTGYYIKVMFRNEHMYFDEKDANYKSVPEMLYFEAKRIAAEICDRNRGTSELIKLYRVQYNRSIAKAAVRLWEIEKWFSLEFEDSRVTISFPEFFCGSYHLLLPSVLGSNKARGFENKTENEAH